MNKQETKELSSECSSTDSDEETVNQRNRRRGSKQSRLKSKIEKLHKLEGVMLKKKPGMLAIRWDERYFKFMLQGQYLLYYKEKPVIYSSFLKLIIFQVEVDANPKGILDIRFITKIKLKKTELKFSYLNGQRNFKLKPKNKTNNQITKWQSAIEKLSKHWRKQNSIKDNKQKGSIKSKKKNSWYVEQVDKEIRKNIQIEHEQSIRSKTLNQFNHTMLKMKKLYNYFVDKDLKKDSDNQQRICMGKMWNPKGIQKWYFLVTRKPFNEEYKDQIEKGDWIFGMTDKPSWFNYNTLYGWYLPKSEYDEEDQKERLSKQSMAEHFNNPKEIYKLNKNIDVNIRSMENNKYEFELDLGHKKIIFTVKYMTDMHQWEIAINSSIKQLQEDERSIFGQVKVNIGCEIQEFQESQKEGMKHVQMQFQKTRINADKKSKFSMEKFIAGKGGTVMGFTAKMNFFYKKLQEYVDACLAQRPPQEQIANAYLIYHEFITNRIMVLWKHCYSKIKKEDIQILLQWAENYESTISKLRVSDKRWITGKKDLSHLLINKLLKKKLKNFKEALENDLKIQKYKPKEKNVVKKIEKFKEYLMNILIEKKSFKELQLHVLTSISEIFDMYITFVERNIIDKRYSERQLFRISNNCQQLITEVPRIKTQIEIGGEFQEKAMKKYFHGGKIIKSLCNLKNLVYEELLQEVFVDLNSQINRASFLKLNIDFCKTNLDDFKDKYYDKLGSTNENEQSLNKNFINLKLTYLAQFFIFYCRHLVRYQEKMLKLTNYNRQIQNKIKQDHKYLEKVFKFRRESQKYSSLIKQKQLSNLGILINNGFENLALFMDIYIPKMVANQLISLKIILREYFDISFIKKMVGFRRGLPKKKRQQIYEMVVKHVFRPGENNISVLTSLHEKDNEKEGQMDEEEEEKTNFNRGMRAFSAIHEQENLKDRLLILKFSPLNLIGLQAVTKVGRFIGLNKVVGGYQERWFVLKKDCLYEYKNQKSKQALHTYQGSIMGYIAKEGSTKLRFKYNKEQIELDCKYAQRRRNWFKALKTCYNNCRKGKFHEQALNLQPIKRYNKNESLFPLDGGKTVLKEFDIQYDENELAKDLVTLAFKQMLANIRNKKRDKRKEEKKQEKEPVKLKDVVDDAVIFDEKEQELRQGFMSRVFCGCFGGGGADSDTDDEFGYKQYRRKQSKKQPELKLMSVSYLKKKGKFEQLKKSGKLYDYNEGKKIVEQQVELAKKTEQRIRQERQERIRRDRERNNYKFRKNSKTKRRSNIKKMKKQ